MTQTIAISAAAPSYFMGLHGDDEHEVINELCRIVDEKIVLYNEDGKPLPEPLTNKGFVNALQGIARIVN